MKFVQIFMNKNLNRVIVIVAFKFCANDAESGIGKKKKEYWKDIHLIK